MSSWNSYPSIYALGHRAVKDLLSAPCNIEEKVDGSQFSFGLIEGELRVRSKGAIMLLDAPEKMFTLAVETVKRLKDELTPEWTYRGEFLAKPKHNTLAYDRVPQGNIILFDINDGPESYLSYEQKKEEAERLGLEVVPLLFSGTPTFDNIRELLRKESILGGQKIEGVVVKPVAYDLFGLDKKVLFGKFVSEAFKEIHQGEWRKENPSSGDIIDQLILEYRTPARWDKAIQHLAEAGKLEGSPRDIGQIIKEIPQDVLKEEEAAIKEKLFKYAWPKVARGIVSGFPEHYKERLLRAQFDATDSAGEKASA